MIRLRKNFVPLRLILEIIWIYVSKIHLVYIQKSFHKIPIFIAKRSSENYYFWLFCANYGIIRYLGLILVFLGILGHFCYFAILYIISVKIMQFGHFEKR